jgi:hypothetical protein
MKVSIITAGSDRRGAMALDLAASFDEVQVGRSRRQEPCRHAQLRGQRLHHLRVLMVDESPESLLLPTKRPFSRGGKLVLFKLIRAVVSWPAVHCDSRSPSPRPSARHLETSRQPSGGVWRPCPNQRNKSDRKENTRQPQLWQHASAGPDQDELQGRCVVPAAAQS